MAQMIASRRSFFLLIFMLFFAVVNIASAEHKCGSGAKSLGKCGTIDGLDKTKSGIKKLNSYKNSYACGTESDLPYVVGWGKSCMVPAGGLLAHDSSCITTPNLIGEVIDTITTVGIGIDMRANFCSVRAGSDQMEGALISNTFFDQCTGNVDEQAKCKAALLRGVNPSNEKHLHSTSPAITNHITSNLCHSLVNLERPVTDDDGQFVFHNGKQAFCPMMRCNIPTDTMMSKYYDRVGPRMAIIASTLAVVDYATGGVTLGLDQLAAAITSGIIGDCADVVELRDGQKKGVAMWKMVKLRGKIEGDKICTQMLFPTGYTTLACKPRSIPKTYYADTNNCYIKNSACAGGKLHSQSFFPLTAKMMECVSDLLMNLFRTPEGVDCPKNPLSAFQDTLKNIVKVMLILYVVLFGVRLAMGEMPRKSELYIFILKFALITYFAVGNVPGTDGRTGLEHVYEAAIDAMSSFSNMVIGNDEVDSGAKLGICQYNLNNYTNGYEYLAVWDSLDCKLAYYLGIASPGTGGFMKALSGDFFRIGLFSLIWGALFAFALPLVLFILAFGILLLSIVIYLTHVYIIAMIAVAITIFMGPIFIPLALFERTKGYFDEWLKLLISYTLYPAVIMAFVSIMLVSFDSIIYSGCEFSQDTYRLGGTELTYWKFGEPISKECKSSFGYLTSQLTAGNVSEIVNFAGGILTFSRVKNGHYAIVDLLDSLMLATFFMFLFYSFAKQLSEFAADVSMSINIGGAAIKPTAIADLAIKYATKGKAPDIKAANKSEGKGKGVNVAGKKRSGVKVSGKRGR